MIRRRDRNLHVVREQEDPTDRIVREILDELNSEDDQYREKENADRHKRAARKRLAAGMLIVLAVAAGAYLLVNLQTYSQVRVLESYGGKGTGGNSYREFAGGVLRYSRDGISYLDRKGDERWNHSYQIKNPYIEAGKVSAVVADKGGNDIVVFRKEGIKGEIHTAMPIEKVSVSEQGIVSAILKNDALAQIVCYDTAGNILVEHKTSAAGTGYPLDLSLSEDGKVLQVLYFYTQDGKISSKVIYYNFGDVGKEKTDNQVSVQEYEDTVMVSGFYLGQSVSAAVGDNCLAIYHGDEIPEEVKRIAIDKEIRSVFHNERYIGLILKNEGKEGNELRLYNSEGKVVISRDFTGEYRNVKLCGGQVILYDGRKCSILMQNGIQKFDGEMGKNILEIFPITGVNRYIVMNADGMDKIRLVK